MYFTPSPRQSRSRGCAYPQLVILPPRRTVERFASLRSFRALCEESAFFVSTDAFVRPESLEDEFAGSGRHRRVGFAAGAEPFDMIKQALNLAQRCELLNSRSTLRHLQIAANFKPLHHRLQVRAAHVFRKHLAHRRAN